MSTHELSEKIKELKELKIMDEELKEEITAIEDAIKTHMGETEELRAGAFKVTYKRVTSSRLDSKRLKAELPDVAAQYTVANEYRHFIVA